MKAITIETCRLKDGTYQCPRCQFTSTKKGLLSHWGRVCGSDNTKKKQTPPLVGKRLCSFCQKEVGLTNIKRHEDNCPQNPKNAHRWINCPVCSKKFYQKGGENKQVCSHRCSNLFFPRDNWMNKGQNYRRICFKKNPHVCAVCSEEKILEVHHIDGNRDNNHITNLVPLCPTHHRYMHSRYQKLIKSIVENYVQKHKVKRVNPGVA